MNQFRLQSVLDFRKRKENAAQKSLFLRLEEQKSLTEKIEKVQNELQRLFEELCEARRRGAVSAELMLYEDCIGFKKKVLEDIRHALEALASAVDQERQKLVKARQEKKSLEILKENQEKEERRNQVQRENMFLDEIAVIGFGEKR
jgi:flagellar export protein FliJ